MARLSAQEVRDIASKRALQKENNNKLNNYLVEEETQPIQAIEERKANFWQRSGETVADFLGSIAKGLGKGVEGIIDAGAGIVGGIGGLFDKDFQDNTRKFIETDYTQELYGKHIDEGTKNSYLNDNKVGEIIEGIGQGVGQMLPAVLATVATGGAGAASLATMGVGAAGNATEEAFNDGADYYKGLGYGAVSGAVEAATEKLTGGLTSNIFGKGLLDGASKSVAKEVGEQGIKRVLKGAAEEGFEEMVSEAVQPVTKAIYKGKDAFNNYNFGEHLKDIAEAGIIGAGTSLAYGGTVSPILSKLGNGAVGAEADIVSSLESNAELENKLARLEYDNKLTEADEAVALKNTRTNYDNISKKLQKMGEEKRAKVIEKYSLGQYFNADGSISENLSQSLESRRLSVEANTEQNSPLANLSRASYSSYLRGQEGRIQETLTKASEQTGVSITVYQGVFEGQSNKNFSSFKKALNAFSNKSGERLSFVVVNPNEKVNAFIDDNVVYIGADKISNNQWMTDVVHEGMHFNESSTEYKTLIDYLSKSGVRVAQANAQLLNRGYNMLDVNVYGSEMNAILAENMLGNEHFINKIVYEELSLGEKILAKIQNFKYMLETIKQQGSRSYRELVQAEKLYLKAIDNYRKGVTHTWNREESNENVTPSNQGVESNGEVKYNRKVAKYIPYSKIGEENVRFIQRELYKLYQGYDNCVADGIAIENGNIVYIVDSGKENGEVNFAFRKKKIINDDELRKEAIRRTNNDSVSKGYISDGLSSKFRLGYDNDIGHDRRPELREELSTNQGKPTNNQEGVLGEDGDRGVRPLKKRPQYSLKDSQGRTLTQEQQEFYQNSKAVDKDGNLQVVYHGTEGEFFTFDKALRGSITGTKDAKLGFFFTSSKEVAKEYAVTAQEMKYYNYVYKIAQGDKDVINLLTLKDGYKQLPQTDMVKRVGELVEKAESGETDIKEIYLNIENPLEKDWKGKAYKKVAMFKVVTEAIQGNYDGVIIRNIEDSVDQSGKYSDVFVAFEPNQIKLTTNKHPTSSEDIRYSLKSFAEQVDDVLNGADTSSTHLKIMETPTILQEAGLPNLPILMTAKHLKTITSAGGKDNSNYHNLSVDIVKNLPSYISEPVVIADSLTRDDSVVIITEAVDSENRPVIAAILLNGKGRLDAKHIRANIMTSAYGKDNFQLFLNRLAQEKAIIYWDKKKSQTLSVSLGVQFPNAITNLDSNSIIRKARAFVNTQDKNTKYSLKSDSRLSEGEFRKIIANLKFEKKYSLNDAKDIVRHLVKKISHDSYFAEFKTKDLDELSHILWKGLNTEQEGYRVVVERVADYLIEHASMQNIYTDTLDTLKNDAQMTLDALKQYLHSLDLRSLKGEITHSGRKELYLRWSAGKTNGGLKIDKLPDLLAEDGIYFDEINPADILFRLDDLYNEANQNASLSEPTYTLEELLGEEELKTLKQSLMRETLFGFEFFGEETDFAKLKKKHESTITKLKEELKEALFASKVKGRISYIAQKITEKKLETFHNATQASDDTFKKSVGILARLDYRGAFNESARNAIQSLSKWYVKENPLLTNAQEPEASIFDQTIADAIIFVASGNGKLTLDELKALEVIIRYFNGFLDTYNKTILNGRWVDVYESAEQYYQVADRNGALRTGKPNKLTSIGRKYSESFSDPAHNARAADMYDENGFNTAMFNEFRQGEKKAAIEEMHILAELEEFYKKNKKWTKEAATRKVTYLNQELPLLEALSLYMSLNREQAVAGLLENGFVYKVDEKGHEQRYEVNGVTEVSEDKTAQAQELRESIKKQLNTQDVQFLDIAWKIFNEKCKKLKHDTDMRLYFYSNIVEGDYFPIKRDGIAYSVEQNFMEEMSLSSLSFNKDTIKGAKGRLFIEPITEVINRHVKGVCQYAHLKTAIDSYNKIYSIDIGGNKNKPKNLRSILPNQRNGMDEYFKKLITDIKGIKIVGETAFNKALSSIRGGFVKFQLGLNLKVLVTQLSSFGASVSIINPVNIIKGFNVRTADLDKYCPLAELRNNENTIVRAQGVIDKIGDFGSLLMKPIGMVDRFVVQRLYAACQYEIASKKNGAKVGTEDNKIEAGKLLETVIFETQQNSMATERSQAMRSHSEIVKALTMFSSDAMKVIGRVLDGFGEISALKARIRIAEGSEKTSFEAKLKVAQKKTIRSIAALVSTSVFMACVAQAFKSLYKKDEDEKVLESMAFDAVGNLLGGLPIIKDIYAYLMEGYDINNYAYNSLNSLLESAGDIIDTAYNVVEGKATTQQIASGTRSMVYAVGQLLGLPVRNLYNTIYGLINRFDSATAYKIDNAFYNKSYSSDLNKALEEGNERLVATISGIMLNENIGDITDGASRKELNRLVLGGYNVIPSAIKDSVSINGEETALTNKQKKAFNNVYSIAHEALASLVKQPLYDNASDETKAKAIKFIYDTYYDVALQDALEVDVDNKNVLFAEAIDIEKLALIIATARSLTADKDKKGNSISGSKKAKVQQYVNSLKLSAAQKYMIMGYLGYSNNNGELKVKTYINRLALSKSEKEALYKYSGYVA